MNKLDVVTPAAASPLHAPRPHDSGPKHVAGAAEYIDDIVEPVGTLTLVCFRCHALPRCWVPEPSARQSQGLGQGCGGVGGCWGRGTCGIVASFCNEHGPPKNNF